MAIVAHHPGRAAERVAVLKLDKSAIAKLLTKTRRTAKEESKAISGGDQRSGSAVER
jgi:hypothetical protein